MPKSSTTHNTDLSPNQHAGVLAVSTTLIDSSILPKDFHISTQQLTRALLKQCLEAIDIDFFARIIRAHASNAAKKVGKVRNNEELLIAILGMMQNPKERNPELLQLKNIMDSDEDNRSIFRLINILIQPHKTLSQNKGVIKNLVQFRKKIASMQKELGNPRKFNKKSPPPITDDANDDEDINHIPRSVSKEELTKTFHDAKTQHIRRESSGEFSPNRTKLLIQELINLMEPWDLNQLAEEWNYDPSKVDFNPIIVDNTALTKDSLIAVLFRTIPIDQIHTTLDFFLDTEEESKTNIEEFRRALIHYQFSHIEEIRNRNFIEKKKSSPQPIASTTALTRSDSQEKFSGGGTTAIPITIPRSSSITSISYSPSTRAPTSSPPALSMSPSSSLEQLSPSVSDNSISSKSNSNLAMLSTISLSTVPLDTESRDVVMKRHYKAKIPRVGQATSQADVQFVGDPLDHSNLFVRLTLKILQDNGVSTWQTRPPLQRGEDKKQGDTLLHPNEIKIHPGPITAHPASYDKIKSILVKLQESILKTKWDLGVWGGTNVYNLTLMVQKKAEDNTTTEQIAKGSVIAKLPTHLAEFVEKIQRALLEEEKINAAPILNSESRQHALQDHWNQVLSEMKEHMGKAALFKPSRLNIFYSRKNTTQIAFNEIYKKLASLDPMLKAEAKHNLRQ
jgi:hypothetical protein